MSRNFVVVLISVYRFLLIGRDGASSCTAMFNNHKQFWRISLIGIGFCFLCAVPRLFEKHAYIEPVCEVDYIATDGCELQLNRSKPNVTSVSKYVAFGLIGSEEFESVGFFKILSHGIISFLFQTNGPVIIILITNLIIFLRLQKYKENSGENINQRDVQRFKAVRRSTADKTVFLVSVGFALLEVPSFFNKLITILFDKIPYNWALLFSYVANFCTVCDSFFNFSIYIFANPEFRKAIWASLCGRPTENQGHSIEIVSLRSLRATANMNHDEAEENR